jgi:hypothetical protein
MPSLEATVAGSELLSLTDVNHPKVTPPIMAMNRLRGTEALAILEIINKNNPNKS